MHNHIQQVLDGDTDAFRFIIDVHKNTAYSLAMSVVKEEHAAQDVVQLAFIRAFTKLVTFKGKSKFSTWFYRIVINEAFKVVRKLDKGTVSFNDDGPVEEEPEVDEWLLKIDEDHQRYYINETLKKLSSNESLALRLFYLEESNVEEITELTGWTKSNAKVILHRARGNMKKELTQLLTLHKQDLYS